MLRFVDFRYQASLEPYLAPRSSTLPVEPAKKLQPEGIGCKFAQAVAEFLITSGRVALCSVRAVRDELKLGAIATLGPAHNRKSGGRRIGRCESSRSAEGFRSDLHLAFRTDYGYTIRERIHPATLEIGPGHYSSPAMRSSAGVRELLRLPSPAAGGRVGKLDVRQETQSPPYASEPLADAYGATFDWVIVMRTVAMRWRQSRTGRRMS